MEIWPLLLLATAISLDGFLVGSTYGIKGIKISILPLFLIGIITALAVYLTGLAGNCLAVKLGAANAARLGSFILIFIGLWLSLRAYMNYRQEEILFSFRIKSLGLIINILQEPVEADMDSSGSINIPESLLLGTALAFDALGVGLGAGLSGFSSFYIPFIIGGTSLLFFETGYHSGRLIGRFIPPSSEIYSGLIIVAIGILRLI